MNNSSFRLFGVLFLFSCTVITSNARGIQVMPGTCEGKDLVAAESAIIDASRLASAGHYAAASYSKPPFIMFFDPTRENSYTVAAVFQRMIHAEQGLSSLIRVSCLDTYNRCNSSRKSGQIMPAYSVQIRNQHHAPEIVMCSAGLALPRDAEPCTEYPGGVSLGWLMVHLMSGLSLISGSQSKISDTKTGTAREVMDQVLMGNETIGNANAYGYLGVWSWALGLGGSPWNRRQTCLENARKGDPDATLWSQVPK